MIAFGELLRDLRTARTATVRAFRGRSFRFVRRTLSQNELARRAGVVPAYVHRAERGVYRKPARRFVEQLAVGLELDAFTTARLLASAGYWPFPELDDDATDLVLGIVFAIGRGDYRMLPESMTACSPESHLRTGVEQVAHR